MSSNAEKEISRWQIDLVMNQVVKPTFCDADLAVSRTGAPFSSQIYILNIQIYNI